MMRSDMRVVSLCCWNVLRQFSIGNVVEADASVHVPFEASPSEDDKKSVDVVMTLCTVPEIRLRCTSSGCVAAKRSCPITLDGGLMPRRSLTVGKRSKWLAGMVFVPWRPVLFGMRRMSGTCVLRSSARDDGSGLLMMSLTLVKLP